MAQQVEIVGAPVKVHEVWHKTGPVYATAPQVAAFTAPQAQFSPAAGVTMQAVWETPLFDLRPDIQDNNGYAGNSTPIGREVWLDGTGFYLFGQLLGFTTANQAASLFNLRAYTLERASVTLPDRAQYIGTRTDVTSDLFAANPVSGSQLFRWRPVGVVRYWSVALILEYTAAIAFNPPLTFSWALH